MREQVNALNSLDYCSNIIYWDGKPLEEVITRSYLEEPTKITLDSTFIRQEGIIGYSIHQQITENPILNLGISPRCTWQVEFYALSTGQMSQSHLENPQPPHQPDSTEHK